MRVRKVALWLLADLFIYCVSFFLVMEPGWPAIDANEEVRFHSACRLCPYPYPVRHPGGLTLDLGRVTFWNYFYYPLDWAIYGPVRNTASENVVNK